MTEITPEAKKIIDDFHDKIDKSYKDYDGTYEKQFYDIILKDGREWLNCWPNANTFHNQEGTVVKGEFVKGIRPAKDPPNP